MKTILSAILFTSLLFTSCGSNQSNDKEKPSNASEQSMDGSEKSGDLEEANNCDDYLDKYEKWSDDYIKLLEKYMKNPMDLSLSTEFMEMAQKGSVWMNQWSNELVACASQKKYQERYEEISERTEKKLKEFGIE